MFFEGCPAHLGCSIKLRGASEYELARVKEIIRLMVCVAYHSQLEISFLMDEFAMPPSLPQSSSFPCLLEGVSAEDEDQRGRGEGAERGSEEAVLEQEGGPPPQPADTDGVPERPKPPSSSSGEEEGAGPPGAATPATPAGPSPFPSPPAPSLHVPPPFLLEEDEELCSPSPEGEEGEEGGLAKQDSLGTEDGEGSDAPPTRLFRDPLQDDSGMFVAEQVASSDDHLKSISAVFKQELKDIILCISPFITFKKPFLLTPAGMHCPSRDYFPEQVPSLSASASLLMLLPCSPQPSLPCRSTCLRSSTRT